MRINLFFNPVVEEFMKESESNLRQEIAAAVTDAMSVVSQFVAPNIDDDDQAWAYYFRYHKMRGIALEFGDLIGMSEIKAIILGVGSTMSRMVPNTPRYASYEIHGAGVKDEIPEYLHGLRIDYVNVHECILLTGSTDLFGVDSDTLLSVVRSNDGELGPLPADACIIDNHSANVRMVVGMENSYRDEIQNTPGEMLKYYVEYLKSKHTKTDSEDVCGKVKTVILNYHKD